MSSGYFIERTHCPGCSGTQFQTLYSCNYLEQPIKDYLVAYYRTSGRLDSSFLEGAAYILEQCRQCELVFQKHIPNAEFCQVLYKERPIPSPEELGYPMEHHARSIELMMTIADYFGDRPEHLRIFDFGFGWASWATFAVALGFQTYGTELTEVKKAFARTRGVRVMEWDEIPGANLHYINTDWVFEHVDDPRGILSHLASGLMPGGFIKINVPDGQHLSEQLKRGDWYAPKESRHSLNVVHPLEHINCYSGHSLEQMARLCGLKPMKIPVRLQYTSFNAKSVSRVAKGLLRPLYRNYGQRVFDCFFVRA